MPNDGAEPWQVTSWNWFIEFAWTWYVLFLLSAMVGFVVLVIGSIHVFRMGYLCVEIQNSVKDVRHIKRTKCDRFVLKKLSPSCKIACVFTSSFVIFIAAFTMFIRLLVFGITGDIENIFTYYEHFFYWIISFWGTISILITFFFIMLLITLNRYVSK
jgi:hypothetical protein